MNVCSDPNPLGAGGAGGGLSKDIDPNPYPGGTPKAGVLRALTAAPGPQEPKQVGIKRVSMEAWKLETTKTNRRLKI
jgi:hypothetical protein